MAVNITWKKALNKPKVVKSSLKVRFQILKFKRIKADMGKIKEEQKCIREEQRNIGERFGEIKRQCDQLREETQLIMKQSTCNRISLVLMFSILRARENREFDQAAMLTRFLKFVSDKRRL